MRMTRFLLLSLLGIASVASATEALTPAEVENLPLNLLAERTLGETGKLMMDVERPKSTLSRAEIIFFSHAFTTGSQYGICGSNWVTLGFNESGIISSIDTERRYGVEASIYTDPKEWTYDEYGSLCDAVRSTRNYFPAPDAQSALTISAYLDLLAEKRPSKPTDYVFECSGSCAKIDVRNYIKNIALKDISSADFIECAQNSPYDKCYKLTLQGDPPGLFPRELRIYGRMRMSEMTITRVALWVGVTYY